MSKDEALLAITSGSVQDYTDHDSEAPVEPLPQEKRRSSSIFTRSFAAFSTPDCRRGSILGHGGASVPSLQVNTFSNY